MAQGPLEAYLRRTSPDKIDAGFLAYLAALTEIARSSPATASSIVKELRDQRANLKLIASENYCSLATQLAMGNLFTDKYAEGYANHRFYAGCDNVDAVESLAADEARNLFGAEHAYVQPHSGADANLIAFWAVISARVEAPALAELGVEDPSKMSIEQWNEVRRRCGSQKLLGLDYYSGGHLTHGYRHNVSAQIFEAHSYSVDRATGLLDYDAIEAQAKALKPLILLAGYSAYPRAIDFERMRRIADGVGAILMVDMAHFAGLVAGGVFTGTNNPVAHAQIVTSTTHKTLRGPRGGLVLCNSELAEFVDKGCPMVMGGPLPHVLAAKAVAFAEAGRPEFRAYQQAIVTNARALAAALVKRGVTIATGGTDNHLMLIDVRPFGLTGRQAESAVRECAITLNRNSLPFDPNGPWYTSGLRIGTPAATTLGMGPAEMEEIADVLRLVLTSTKAEVAQGTGKPSKAKFLIDDKARIDARDRIHRLLDRFPVYPQLELAVLEAFIQ
jgi:glycine hydroxymethyltransferase